MSFYFHQIPSHSEVQDFPPLLSSIKVSTSSWRDYLWFPLQAFVVDFSYCAPGGLYFRWIRPEVHPIWGSLSPEFPSCPFTCSRHLRLQVLEFSHIIITAALTHSLSWFFPVVLRLHVSYATVLSVIRPCWQIFKLGRGPFIMEAAVFPLQGRTLVTDLSGLSLSYCNHLFVCLPASEYLLSIHPGHMPLPPSTFQSTLLANMGWFQKLWMLIRSAFKVFHIQTTSPPKFPAQSPCTGVPCQLIGFRHVLSFAFSLHDLPSPPLQLFALSLTCT